MTGRERELKRGLISGPKTKTRKVNDCDSREINLEDTRSIEEEIALCQMVKFERRYRHEESRDFVLRRCDERIENLRTVFLKSKRSKINKW